MLNSDYNGDQYRKLNFSFILVPSIKTGARDLRVHQNSILALKVLTVRSRIARYCTGFEARLRFLFYVIMY